MFAVNQTFGVASLIVSLSVCLSTYTPVCLSACLSIYLCIVEATLSWNIFHCLSSGGRIFSWGWNEHGMCGDGSLCDITQPRPVPGLTDATALLIGCGAGHSMALCSLKSNKDSASWTGFSVWLSLCLLSLRFNELFRKTCFRSKIKVSEMQILPTDDHIMLMTSGNDPK